MHGAYIVNNYNDVAYKLYCSNKIHREIDHKQIGRDKFLYFTNYKKIFTNRIYLVTCSKCLLHYDREFIVESFTG